MLWALGRMRPPWRLLLLLWGLSLPPSPSALQVKLIFVRKKYFWVNFCDHIFSPLVLTSVAVPFLFQVWDSLSQLVNYTLLSPVPMFFLLASVFHLKCSDQFCFAFPCICIAGALFFKTTFNQSILREVKHKLSYNFARGSYRRKTSLG